MEKIWKKVLGEYISNHFRTRKQILKTQKNALRKIVEYAYQHSRYYHDSFTKVGVTSENIHTFPFDKLPLTNKKIFLDNYDDILTNQELSYDKIMDYPDELGAQYHVVHSSGSSGKPFYFVYEQTSWDLLVVLAMREIIKAFGLKKVIKAIRNKTKILYIGMTNGAYGGVLAFASTVQKFKFEIKLLDINKPINEILTTAKEFNPDYIMGYPTAVALIVESIMSNFTPRIKGIITTGETLSKSKRKYIEDTCHCPILNFYGASESFLIACEHASAFSIFDDYTYVEVINHHAYITNLHNYLQPLIRYEMSDYIEFINDKKSKYHRCHILTGREEDILWFTSKTGVKEYLHPLMFEDFCYDGLYDYQLIQDANDHFNLVFVTNKPCQAQAISDFLAKGIKNILNEHKLSFVTFSIKQVDQIMPEIRTGKKCLTIGLKEDVSTD